MLDHARVTVRPIATPLPITFLGLMVATTVVAGWELGVVPRTSVREVGWILLAVPVPMQLLAAAWGFVTRSAAAATGSAVLSATWLAVALTSLAAPPGQTAPSVTVGLLLVTSAAAMLVPVLAEIRAGALLPALVMGTTVVRFAITAVSGLTGAHAWGTASGYCGLVLGGVALYGALALELESAGGQTPVLPVFRVRSARRAMEGSLDEQLRNAARESGIRQTL
ncbi:MAG TPA: hypothetical protein VFJ77_09495 [Gaiellaceae bacterium]|nr:hypothetical protein [Gaiellaceae bacterium]